MSYPTATGAIPDEGNASSFGLDGEPGMYLGNLARTGEFHGSGMPTLHDVLWERTLSDEIRTQPVFGDGLVYVAGRHLYALDAASGTISWQTRAYGATPAISGGTVFYGWDKALHAADTRTGVEKWRFQTTAEIESSPAVADGVVYFGSNDGHLYAIDVVNGEQRWKLKLGDRMKSDPVIANGVIYIGTEALQIRSVDNSTYISSIAAVDAQSGLWLWAFSVPERSVVAPMLGAELVFCMTGIGDRPYARDNTIYALDAASGAEVWQYQPAGGVSTRPAYSGNTLYIATSEGVEAFDVGTKQTRWIARSGHPVSGISIAKDVVYFSSLEAVHAVDAATGIERWRKALGGAYDYLSAPLIVDDAIYVAGRTELITALR